MQQFVTIRDDALGNWKLEVTELCKHMDGHYAFEDYGNAVDLDTGEVCTDQQFLQMLAEYALEEGYVEQRISWQCSVLYEEWERWAKANNAY